MKFRSFNRMRFFQDKQKIELATIGFILLVLILVVVYAIRPSALFKESRNATRVNDMENAMTAVWAYAAGHRGIFPLCIPIEGSTSLNNCMEELAPYLIAFPKDINPNYEYRIGYIPGFENRIKIYSTAPEAEGIIIIR